MSHQHASRIRRRHTFRCPPEESDLQKRLGIKQSFADRRERQRVSPRRGAQAAGVSDQDQDAQRRKVNLLHWGDSVGFPRYCLSDATWLKAM
jgi:hypothetical protein